MYALFALLEAYPRVSVQLVLKIARNAPQVATPYQALDHVSNVLLVLTLMSVEVVYVQNAQQESIPSMSNQFVKKTA